MFRVSRVMILLAGVAMAGAFGAGTWMRKEAAPAGSQTKTVYNVVYTDAQGVTVEKVFGSAEEHALFLKKIEQQGATGIATAELGSPGHM